jgi:hypothetical protein
MGGHAEKGDLILTPMAKEGVEILERAASSDDPEHYLAVQDMLLRDTEKHAPTDGPEVDLVSQVPLPLDERDEAMLDQINGRAADGDG